MALLNSVFRRVVSLTGGVKRPLVGAAGRVFSTGAGALNLLLDRSDGDTGFTVSSCHDGLLLFSGKVQQFLNSVVVLTLNCLSYKLFYKYSSSSLQFISLLVISTLL